MAAAKTTERSATMMTLDAQLSAPLSHVTTRIHVVGDLIRSLTGELRLTPQGSKDPLQLPTPKHHGSQAGDQVAVVVDGGSVANNAQEGEVTETTNDCESQLEPAQRRSRCTGNLKVLLLTATLFTTITVAQIVAALAANSMALLQDSVSMAVDAGTYLANMVVELLRGRRSEAAAELIISIVSVSVLLTFTLIFMREGWMRLQNASADKEDTNPYIVLAFAIWGLVFDVCAMFAFWWNGRKSEDGHKVNMCTAFLHVGADFLRSSTTLIASILMLVFRMDTGRIDAWASLVVGAIILLGAGGAILAILSKVLQCMRGGGR